MSVCKETVETEETRKPQDLERISENWCTKFALELKKKIPAFAGFCILHKKDHEGLPNS